MSSPQTKAVAIDAEVRIEQLSSLKHFEDCVAIERAVWGYNPEDIIPSRVFLVAYKIGGQVLGAFVDGKMAGFAMALPGFRDGRPYLHSHMLGVLSDYRNFGLGRRLKLAQRDEAISRGFELMEWTFDPLEIKNAHLNIARLGVIVRRYAPNFYGASSSPLQAGLPTDRVYAEWWLKSNRVEQTLRGEAEKISPIETAEVPAEIYAWKASGDPRAREVQQRNATILQDAFARGLVVTGYERSERGDGKFLLAEMPQL